MKKKAVIVFVHENLLKYFKGINVNLCFLILFYYIHEIALIDLLLTDMYKKLACQTTNNAQNIKGKENEKERLEMIGFRFVLTHYEYISWVNLQNNLERCDFFISYPNIHDQSYIIHDTISSYILLMVANNMLRIKSNIKVTNSGYISIYIYIRLLIEKFLN